MNNEKPVFVVAAGADVSPKGPDGGRKWTDKLMCTIAGKVEDIWNKGWKLDPNPNKVWISKLGEYLKSEFGSESEVVTLDWSGSASLLPSVVEEAKNTLKKQLDEVSKKFPGRPIIAICKSLSGPYLIRMLQEEPGLTVTQFISLGSPWGRKDSIPENVRDAVFVESRGDIFYKIGHIFRFFNVTFKRPRRKKGTEFKEPTLITIDKPTHGGLNYDSTTGEINEKGPSIFEGLSPESMYSLLRIIIKKVLK